jgi:hypothetical protein
MRRAPFASALGLASILTFAVSPASAQHRSDSGSRSDDATPRYSAGARYDAPVRFVTPYYTFRARVSLGFGLFIGYPVAYGSSYYYPDRFYAYAYAYAYPYGYAYRYPYAYPYRYPYSYPTASLYPAPGPIYYQAPAGLDRYASQAQNSVGAQAGPTRQVSAGLDLPDPPPARNSGEAQNRSNMGGLSFEITPSDARVIVDGEDVGDVGQFTPRSAPLGLTVGRHHIEIVANGYRTMSSDVEVLAGQVIPFQGQMER